MKRTRPRHIHIQSVSLSLYLVLLVSCQQEAATPDVGDMGDGGDSSECAEVVACDDLDGDGYVVDSPCCIIGFQEIDCDDDDFTSNPGANEICGDDADNDCDGWYDEPADCAPCEPECELGDAACSGPSRISYCDGSSGCPIFASPVECPGDQGCRDSACVEVCVDRDNDGFMPDCGDTRDCDDERSDVFPGNPEVCDGVDNNCDRRTDENFICDDECVNACVREESNCTADGLGYVACRMAANGCTYFTGAVMCPTGSFCDGGSCVSTPLCVDYDLDGYGPGCGDGVDYDCRPSEAANHPGASEICDGLDNDCDGTTDQGSVCDPCTPSTGALPRPGGFGQPVYGVSCGSTEFVALGSVDSGDRITVGLSSLAAVSDFEIGRPQGEGMARIEGGFTLGLANGLLWEATSSEPSLLVSFDLPAGSPYRLSASLEQPSADCLTDDHEPNDSPGIGLPVGPPPFVGAGTICGRDMDFFVVEPEPGRVLTASLTHDGGNRLDLIVSIWRNGALMAPTFAGPTGGLGFPDGHHTFIRTDLPGTYAVAVQGLSTTTNNDYTLTIDERALPCDDPNDAAGGLDDDTFGTARELAPNTTLNGLLCPGDVDIISLGRLSEGAHITGRLTHSVSEGNLDGRMLRQGWAGLVQDQHTDNDDEIFDNNISTIGTYYIAIFGRSAEDSASYSFRY